MRIWKKALSTVMSAALLASLLGTAFATSVFAAADDTAYMTCSVAADTATCSQVADGISSVTLAGAGTLAGNTLYASLTGSGTIIGVVAPFVLTGGIVTAPEGALAAGSITVRSPAAPGTGVISVYTISTTTGISTLEGTMTITWTASSGLAVSEANSTVKIGTAAACGTTTTTAEADGAPSIFLCVTLKNANAASTDGTVAVTITPVGLVSDGGAAYAQAVSEASAAGYAEFSIKGSGLAGIGTIGISVTQGTATTSFAPKTVTFTGEVASITLANASSVGAVSTTKTDALTYIAKDAAGNRVDLLHAGFVATYSTGAPFTVTGGVNTTATVKGTFNAVCGATAGTGTVSVKIGTITSNAVTFNCSTAADTYSVAFDKTTVNPGGQATITVTVKDAGGRPAPDGLAVTIVVSSGAVLATTGGVTADGVATWTYLAPFNTGVVTVLATASVLTSTSPQSASTTVGAVVPVTFTFNVTGTALGNTLTGPFTSSTKISTGGYITWRFDGGVAAAGKTIEIWAYKKVGLSTNPWSAPYLLTTRVANASGVAFANITSGSVIWLSIRPVLAATATDAAVWGPWSIGRWIH